MDISKIVVTAMFALLGSFLGLIFTRLYDYMWKPFFINHNMKRLREAMDHLKARCDDVKVQVSKAELELKTCTHEVKWWLDKVKSTEDEVNHIEDQILRWRSNYGIVYSCMIFWKRYSVGYKVVTKRREVTKLHDQGAFNDVATTLPSPAARVLPSTPRVQAMDSNRDQILQYLKDDEVKIIGIWGMGGVGKTTLLKQINNYFAYNQHLLFDHVIFVVASKGVNVEELQKKILRTLQLPSEIGDDMDSRAAHLLNFCKEKKILLLLDDLWEHVNLVSLGIPIGLGRCKLIFTTRSIHVCSFMKAEREFKVECLSEKEALTLFKENVGENIIKADPNICCLAKEVVKECRGLPLALITIGRVMSAKKTCKEWQNALILLQSSRHNEISGIQDDIFLILKLSYQNLQDETLRECFLTCSMWPEDYNIYKGDLIKCWIGLGLIDDYNDINEAYNRGHSIIETLIGACLLENGWVKYIRGESFVKMHDVLRDLALWIVSDHGNTKNKWMVQAGIGLKECKAERWLGRHRISLMYNHLESLPEQLPDCPNLCVLMLRGNNLQNIPQRVFNCFRSLTYLDLSHSSIKELPATVGGMINLTFLSLEYTGIKFLPGEVGNLVNLKYLLLGGTYDMESIPWKSISGLSMLKFLDLFDCKGAAEMEFQGGFEALEQLDGRLMALRINIDTVTALNRLSKISTISIAKLEIKHLEGTESLELLSPDLFGSKSTSSNLNQLFVHVCRSLKMLNVNSLYLGGTPRPVNLPKLETLHLVDLTQLEKIVWKGVTPKEFLPSLHSLKIQGCGKLKDVSWVLQLPNLKFLELGGCDELETVLEDAEDSGDMGKIADRVDEHILSFPRLRKLELVDLPNLHSICSTIIPFPSLEDIAVVGCPKLKRLPFQASNICNKLQEIRGEAKWWEHLEWKDDRTKPLLQNHFKEWF